MSEIVGQKIVQVRTLTQSELDAEGWWLGIVTAIILENGIVLYASRDEEGNEPGVIFYHDAQDKTYMLLAEGG